MKRVSLLLCLLLSPVLVAKPKLKTQCFQESKPLPWSYCRTETVGSGNRDVLYHFHGKGLSEKTWAETDYYTAQIRQAWEATGHEAPVVVSVSFGPIWLLVEKNKSPASGLLEVFTHAVMPTVEKGIPRFSGRRAVLGESMGGFNATQVALKLGRDFRRVAILCPPIVSLSPFASKDEIEKFIQTHKAKPELAEQVVQISRYFLPEESDWHRHSPLELVRQVNWSHSPKVYLSCGSYDEYGFFKGTERFAAIATARGASLQWRPLYGGHCAIDIHSVASFLAR